MSAEIIPLPKKDQQNSNAKTIEALEGLLERLKSGEAKAAAFVEVQEGLVATYWCNPGAYYHYLCSGAARLAARVATG